MTYLLRGMATRLSQKTWHAEGSTKHSDRYAILLRLIETNWELKAEADGYDLSPLLRVCVFVCLSVCVFVRVCVCVCVCV